MSSPIPKIFADAPVPDTKKAKKVDSIPSKISTSKDMLLKIKFKEANKKAVEA